VALLISLFLMAVGPLIAFAGCRAIRTQHYQTEWQEDRELNIGPIAITNSAAYGVDQYNGTKALTIGIGLSAFGAMFIVWGLGRTWSFLRPGSLELSPRAGAGLCLFSSILQTTALVCILPPWHIGTGISPVFCGTTVLLIALLVVAWKFDLASQIKLWKKILVVLAVIALGTSIVIGGQSGLGVVVAVFVCISYAVHGIFLHGFAMKRRASS
jgi:hypothetical protein